MEHPLNPKTHDFWGLAWFLRRYNFFEDFLKYEITITINPNLISYGSEYLFSSNLSRKF